MNKKLFVLLVLLIILCLDLISNISKERITEDVDYGKAEKYSIDELDLNEIMQIKEEFKNWQDGKYSGQEGRDLINRLENYLSKYPETSNNMLLEMNDFIRVIANGKVRVVEYIENPEFYGSSSRNSYQIIQSEDNINTMIEGGSIKIYNIIQHKDDIYLLGTNYMFSNILGLVILKVNLSNGDFKVLAQQAAGAIPEQEFINMNGELFSKNAVLNIEDISEDKLEFTINNSISKYKMKIVENNAYMFCE